MKNFNELVEEVYIKMNECANDKQYYGMKWKVAEVVMNSETDGIYTGK